MFMAAFPFRKINPSKTHKAAIRKITAAENRSGDVKISF
jgi:hypothetical protein